MYTAAQIAAALGITVRWARLALTATAADGLQMVRGKATKTWSLAALPESLRGELSAPASRRLVTVEQLLAAPPVPWQPPIWCLVPAAAKERAEKLRDALAPALARQHELAGPELMELARTFYRQHFGQEIESDKLRDVMDRATRRDNGFNQWQRPELYLDDASVATAAPAPGKGNLHHALEEYIAALENKSEPTLKDRQAIFHEAFKHFEALVAEQPAKREQHALKRSLVSYLYRNLPALYRPKTAAAGQPLAAMRKLYNRLYTEWIAGGRTAAALRDERAGNCGRKGYRCRECDQKIRAVAARLRGAHGTEGNVDLAVKRCLENGGVLCPVCTERRKYFRMTEAERKRCTPNAIEIAATKGPAAIRKIGPTHHCDWSDTQPGDRFVIDDMTTNEMGWDDVDGRVISGQVQLLYTEDEFSAKPLPFLMYFGHPNSQTIKRAVALVLTNIGLPHVALYTERGVFANRMLAGDRRAKDQVHFRELQQELEQMLEFGAMDDATLQKLRQNQLGLCDPVFGLKIQQATSPQAKSVERSFYELQKTTSTLPGFGGFNQRLEQTKAMQDFTRRVKSGLEHPGNEWLHLRELRKNYDEACAKIERRPVNGLRHRGRTPLDVWTEVMERRPFRKLPPEIEHLLATHRLPALKVHAQGIKVQLDKFETAFYFNEHTGPLAGQTVAARINYDLPEFIHIETPEGKLRKVERALTRRRTATKEELAAVNAARRAHINGALAEAGNVDQLITSWVVRDHAHTDQDKERGRTIGAATAAHQQEQAEHRAARRKIEDLARARGDDPDTITNSARYAEAVAREDEILARIAAKQTKAATP
jgi:hypothetical protein